MSPALASPEDGKPDADRASGDDSSFTGQTRIHLFLPMADNESQKGVGVRDGLVRLGGLRLSPLPSPA
jgi:hypothetical protein